MQCRTHHRLVPLLFIVSLASLGQGQTTQPTVPTDELDARVVEIARDLSADEFATRQRAEDALVELGQPAMSSLQRLLETTDDAEALSRLQSAIKRIEEQVRLGPTLITLHLRNASAEEAFEALSAQLPKPLKAQGPHVFEGLQDRVTLDCVNEPFWSVMLKLTEQTGIGFATASSGSGGNELVRLSVRKPPPYQLFGGFLVRAESAQRIYSIQYASGDATISDFNLLLTVWPDPKMQVFAGPSARNVKIVRAEDDQGRQMLDNQGSAGGWRSPATVNLSLRLRANNADAKKLAILQGTLSIPLNLGFETVIHDKLSNEAEKRIGNMLIRIQPLEKVNDRRYLIRFSVYRQGASDEAWSLINHSVFSSVRLEDKDGRQLDRAEWSSSENRAQIIEGTVNFNRLPRGNQEVGEPVKVIWTIPTEVREIEVPFEFHDLPLPG